MTADEIASARKIIEAATPGPWDWHKTHTAEHLIDRRLDGTHIYHNYPLDTKEGQYADADCAFIAAARELLPRCLDEIERLNGELLKEFQCINCGRPTPCQLCDPCAKMVAEISRLSRENTRLLAVAEAAAEVSGWLTDTMENHYMQGAPMTKRLKQALKAWKESK